MKLEIKENQPEQQKQIRRKLKEGVLDLNGFLLPYPGKDVATKRTYRGLVRDVDEEFLHCVRILVSNIFSKENMVTKQMNFADVKGKEMVDYIEKFVSVLSDGNCPRLETTVEVIAQKGRQLGIAAALALYKRQMQQCLEKGKVSMEKLKEHHQKFKKDAIDFMKKYPRIIVSEYEVECITDLDNKIDDAYNSYQNETTEGKRKIKIKKAKELATDLIIPISTGIAGCAGIICHLPAIYTTSAVCLCGWGIAKYLAYITKEKYD